MPPVPTYAIVGAGFSGIAVAVHLLRKLPTPTRVLLINRNHKFGRGLAYGTRSAGHLLNVPAGRMSLTPGDDGEFVRFLHQHGLHYRPSDFVPRKLYGEYLESTLEHAQPQALPGVELQLVQAEAEALDFTPGAAQLRLRDARVLEATQIVLALGNFAPWPPALRSRITCTRLSCRASRDSDLMSVASIIRT